MEQYILEHADRYRMLARSFKPPGTRAGTGSDAVNPDVTVAARLRPLLNDELSTGMPQGVFLRTSHDGVLDVHELKRPIRGPPALPTLKVRTPTSPKPQAALPSNSIRDYLSVVGSRIEGVRKHLG